MRHFSPGPRSCPSSTVRAPSADHIVADRRLATGMERSKNTRGVAVTVAVFRKGQYPSHQGAVMGTPRRSSFFRSAFIISALSLILQASPAWALPDYCVSTTAQLANALQQYQTTSDGPEVSNGLQQGTYAVGTALSASSTWDLPC